MRTFFPRHLGCLDVVLGVGHVEAQSSELFHHLRLVSGFPKHHHAFAALHEPPKPTSDTSLTASAFVLSVWRLGLLFIRFHLPQVFIELFSGDRGTNEGISTQDISDRGSYLCEP